MMYRNCVGYLLKYLQSLFGVYGATWKCVFEGDRETENQFGILFSVSIYMKIATSEET